MNSAEKLLTFWPKWFFTTNFSFTSKHVSECFRCTRNWSIVARYCNPNGQAGTPFDMFVQLPVKWKRKKCNYSLVSSVESACFVGLMWMFTKIGAQLWLAYNRMWILLDLVIHRWIRWRTRIVWYMILLKNDQLIYLLWKIETENIHAVSVWLPVKLERLYPTKLLLEWFCQYFPLPLPCKCQIDATGISSNW